MAVASANGRYNYLSLHTHYVEVLSVHHSLYRRSSSAVVLRDTLVRKVQHLKCRIQLLFLQVAFTVPSTCGMRAGVTACLLGFRYVT